MTFSVGQKVKVTKPRYDVAKLKDLIGEIIKVDKSGCRVQGEGFIEWFFKTELSPYSKKEKREIDRVFKRVFHPEYDFIVDKLNELIEKVNELDAFNATQKGKP